MSGLVFGPENWEKVLSKIIKINGKQVDRGRIILSVKIYDIHSPPFIQAYTLRYERLITLFAAAAKVARNKNEK